METERLRDHKGRFMPNESNSQTGEQNQSQPSYVTAEDVGNIVNAAVTNHLKRSLGKEIGAALSLAFEERDKAKAAKRAEKEAAEAAAGGGGSPKPAGPAPEVAALQKKLDDMARAMAATKEEAAQERAKARQQKAFADLKGELNGKVKPEALDMCAEWIFHAKQRVRVDDEGNVLFTLKHSPAKGMPEVDTDFPLADGVREFLKSKEAAMFVPAPGAQGQARQQAGTRPQQLQAPVQQPQSNTFVLRPSADGNKAAQVADLLGAMGLELP